MLRLGLGFSETSHSIRRVCAASTLLFLCGTVIAAGVNGYILRCLYEKDTWCSKKELTHAELTWTTASPLSAILREDRRPLLVPRRRICEVAPLILQGRPAAPLAVSPLTDPKPRCNPFEGCISSYRDMGFDTAVGYQLTWATLGVAILALVVELLMVAVRTSVVPQAGITEEAASLLHQQDDDRVI